MAPPLAMVAVLATSVALRHHGGRRVPAPRLALGDAPAPWSYTALLEALDQGAIARGAIAPDATLRAIDVDGGAHVTQLLPAQAASVADRFAAAGVDVAFVTPTALQTALRGALDLLPLLALAALVMGRGAGVGALPSPFGRTKARALSADALAAAGKRFDDVAGLSTAKEELFEVVAALKDPERFAAAGARAPRGVLLEGPPGTGKTLLARAVAGEAGVPFLAASASSFVEMYVGLGAARVRALFEEARSAAPCLVWIDEIDALGRRRASAGAPGGGGGGADERESTLNELLAAMDGFAGDAGVVVLAATNRADVLDDALLRPGRFDRRVPVGLPDAVDRAAILAVHARTKTLEADVALDALAAQTPGFSGAQLANLLNEAAVRALRRNATRVSRSDVGDALDRVVAGLPLARPLDAASRERVAVHEAGHALVACVARGYDPVARVTIVPRASGAGGFTSFALDEARATGGLLTRAYLETELAVLLGGRAAEAVVFGASTVTTGASSDLARVQDRARRMVAEWGMGDSLVAYEGARRVGLRAQDTMDRQVEELVDAAYASALSLLQSHAGALRRLTAALIERETLDGDAVRALVAPPVLERTA
jgi:cell division protease FtsH